MPIFSQDLTLDRDNDDLYVLMNKGSNAVMRQINVEDKFENDLLQI